MSREQAVTNDLRLVWRYVEDNSSVGAQRDETTGVKQLSALAASGEKMLLNQEASPLSAGQLKAQGSKVGVSRNRSHLFGCRLNRWALGGGLGFLKHLIRQEERKKKLSKYQECPPHTVSHSPHTRHNNLCLPLFLPLLCLLCSFVRNCYREKQKKRKEWPPLVHTSVFVCVSQGQVLFLFRSFLFCAEWETAELHLCFKSMW